MGLNVPGDEKGKALVLGESGDQNARLEERKRRGIAIAPVEAPDDPKEGW